MPKMRITKKIDPEKDYPYDAIHIEEYTLKEVLLPPTVKRKSRKAIAITIRGRNFKAVAQPLIISVGNVQVQYLKFSPDERTIEGILLKEPKKGAPLDIKLSDIDHARHPKPFDSGSIERIKE